jgi:DNA-binding winged helix-turn-helix (wHTH) protein
MASHDTGPDWIYRFDDVEVCTRTRTLLRDGKLVGIEPKAFAVLLELLAHPGETLTRDALLDHVWGHRHVTAGVLNRIIAQLRRALGDDAGHPHVIRTVHGLGYGLMRPVVRSCDGGEGASAQGPAEALPPLLRVVH